MSTITIETAHPEDAYLLAEFSRKSFYESFIPTNSEQNMQKFLINFSVEKLADEVLSGDHYFFVAKKNEIIVGYVKMTDHENLPELVSYKSVEIARIYVDQTVLGQGIGHLLMDRALDHAKQKGYNLAWLGVWEKNYAAQAFYTKWGFERFGEHIFMLGEDPQLDWLLKRTI
jgi:ribosomal protein S18 acetylase RimI-like enzyme